MKQRVVLCIEDNYLNRRLVRKILKSRGYKVLEAEDGEIGWQMVRQKRPPLVLMDIDLPKMSGLEVTKLMKADANLRHIPIIALTASAMRGDRERFLAAGCDDHLSKPFQPLDLLAMVDDHYPKSELGDAP